MSTGNRVDAGGKPVGRRERRAGGTLMSSEDCRILQIEDRGILRLVLTRLEPRRGRRILTLTRLPPTHLGSESNARKAL